MKNRIRVLIFCFLLLFGLVATVWADSEKETVFSVSYEGEEISEIIFPEDEKRVIEVTANHWSDSYEFQWQILLSIEDDLWADILDQTGQSMEVSYALIEEVMDDTQSAYVRCEITDGDVIYYTGNISVTTTTVPALSDSEVQMSDSNENVPMLLADSIDTNKVTITINYLDASDGEAIYSPYVAELAYGTDFPSTRIVSPTFLGYAPYYNAADPDIEITAGVELIASDDATALVLEYKGLTQNVVINVYYKPIEVSYTIQYFFQDVNSDLYTENAAYFTMGYAKTGTIMEDDDIALSAEQTEGFTKLYHYPESVAADGSTAFECYYDRNYYLLKFDMNGGYGVDPVYGRYDAAFVVNTPVKPGYEFAGWDLVSETKDGITTKYQDGVVDTLPSNIPAASQSYIAVWKEIKTTYTVVYWTQNANDDEYSYVGSEVREALSNSNAQGACPTEEHSHVDTCLICDNTEATHSHTEDCYGCGMIEHSHTDECYNATEIIACGEQELIHTNECYKSKSDEHTHVIDCYTAGIVSSKSGSDILNMSEHYNDGHDGFTRSVQNPTSGYLYVTNWWGKIDNYFYLNDTWYHLGEYGDYEGVIEKTKYTNLKAQAEALSGQGYVSGEADVDFSLCSNMELSCGETGHIHTDDCYFNLRHYEYQTSDIVDDEGNPITIKVMGDGTTVVNVKYTRKIYTFRFYISRSYENATSGATVYEVPGSTTNYAGVSDGNLQNMFGAAQWGEVSASSQVSLNDIGVAAGYQIKTTTEKIGDYYYQYFDLSAKYGEYIKDKFPVGMLNPVKMASETLIYGDTAYFSAWTVEHHTWYNWHKDNKTLKGRYLNLDYQMLYNYCLSNDEDLCKGSGHTQYDDSATISFLAFWENAVITGNYWNEPHKFIYKSYVPVLSGETVPEGTVTREYNSVTYKLIDTCEIYDNNNDENTTEHTNAGWLKEHTAPSIEGYEIAYTSGKCLETWTTSNNKTMTTCEVNFFYTRNGYSLKFVNRDQISKSEDKIPYESSLASYQNYEPDYPSTLEKNAYYFDGWYTTEKCIQGTEFDFASETMPASDLILYAKWTPEVHTVRFFENYEDMLKFETSNDESLIYDKREVNHGEVVGTVTEPKDSSEYNYSFGGWFYIENGAKTAFTPLDMPVKKDINVFADWGSHTAQPFVIHYALKERVSADDSERIKLLNEAANNSPSDNVRYEITYNGNSESYVYLKEDNGWHRCIADSTTGFAYQGSTRTFTAKAGDPYNQLYSQYNGGYFPLVSSHSITLAYESNQLEPANNVFTFQYVYTQNLSYVVRYVDKTTGLEFEGVDSGKVYKAEGKSVVTARFKAIANYVPDAFYKRLVLSVVENADGSYSSSPDNEIIFYYMPNDTVSYYAVHYMLQKPNTTGDDKKIDGTGHYEESSYHTEGVGNIGTAIQVKPLSFTGFDVILENGAAVVMDGVSTVQNVIKGDDGDKYCEISVVASGTELYIFYKRLSYNYAIYHLRYGANLSEVLEALARKEDHEDLLYVQNQDEHNKALSAQFGTTVTATTELKPADDKFEGRVCVSALEQTITIKAYNDQNNIVFYYAPVQYTVEYSVAGDVGGTVSLTKEVVDNTTPEFKGSTATADPGYEFAGWYCDEECTIRVSDQGTITDGKFIPELEKLNPMPTLNKFYAKFEPQYGSLTITREQDKDEGYGDQVYVYKITNVNEPTEVIYVTLQVSGEDSEATASVTIYNLLQTDYIVEQQTGWSWRYDDPDTVGKPVTITVDGAEVTFENNPKNVQWLNANSNVEKNVKGVIDDED